MSLDQSIIFLTLFFSIFGLQGSAERIKILFLLPGFSYKFGKVRRHCNFVFGMCKDYLTVIFMFLCKALLFVVCDAIAISCIRLECIVICTALLSVNLLKRLVKWLQMVSSQDIENFFCFIRNAIVQRHFGCGRYILCFIGNRNIFFWCRILFLYTGINFSMFLNAICWTGYSNLPAYMTLHKIYAC